MYPDRVFTSRLQMERLPHFEIDDSNAASCQLTITIVPLHSIYCFENSDVRGGGAAFQCNAEQPFEMDELAVPSTRCKHTDKQLNGALIGILIAQCNIDRVLYTAWRWRNVWFQ